MNGQAAGRKSIVGGLILIALALSSFQLQAGRDGFLIGLFNRGSGNNRDAVARQLDPPPYAVVSQTRLTADGVLSPTATGSGSGNLSNGFQVTVAVEPPPGAVQMQLADNVGFLGTVWQPIDTEANVAISSAGYQTVFARFKLDDGSVGPISVVGVGLDPFYDAATSSVDGLHEPSWVRPFSTTEIAVRIEAGRIERGALEAYNLDNPPDGDDIVVRGGPDLINRDGQNYGLAVSERRDVIRRGDTLVGKPFDVDEATSNTWTIESTNDPRYQQTTAVASIRHLSRPAGGGLGNDGNQVWAVTHDLVLSMPTALTAGSTYTITPAGTVAPISFTYQPDSMLSPAVQVAHTGIARNDQPKIGYLAGWFDGLGSTATSQESNTASTSDPGPEFSVIDTATGSAVYQGTATPRPGGNEMGHGDLTGSTVFELDFTPVNASGRYQLCVSDVGCSHPFQIDDDIWLKMTDTVARAVYHQRSGVELGPPFTPVERPRPYHPDDGVVVNLSDFSLLDAQSSTDNTDFEVLAQQSTPAILDQAWGGHFDAGDWDRRINHLWYVRSAAMLTSLYPELFADRDLNIPESGDDTPDLLDEALWSLDLYRRLQRDDGAVSGGIEASAHPPFNATSWVDDLAVYAYQHDIYSSYIYAGVAAEVGLALEPYDSVRSADFTASAARAMEWAETEWPSLDSTLVDYVRPQRNVAAAAMLATTEDQRWHEIFVATAPYLEQTIGVSCHAHSQCDGAWLYLQTPPSATDPAIREHLVDMFRSSADAIVTAAESTAYGWTTENPGVPLIWGLGSGGAAHNNGLLRAYLLTEDERYREAAVRSTQVAMGANPQNRALMTGVGYEPVRHPQINDVKHGGLPPWPGVPVYGRHQLGAESDDTWVTRDVLVPAGASPDPAGLPYLWQWYDISNVAFFNEFTVHQGQADSLWNFGVLAATRK